MNKPDQHEIHVHPVLACLGVASRFRMVRALAVADRCVGELAEAVGLSQSCTTRHLQALERVGLVKGHREGRRVRFRLRAEAPGLSELLGWALSGAGLETLTVGRSPHRDYAEAWPITERVTNRTPATGATQAQDRAVHAPTTESEPVGPAGPIDLEERNSQAVTGHRPTRRPDELEDYLL
jgi:DNA-binding transcriptional ArsR family regulator